MAETTLLRSSANVRNASPNATSAGPHAQLSGALPVVQVNMNANGPRVQGGRQVKQGLVTFYQPRAGTRKFTTGGLPNQPAKQAVVVAPLNEPSGVIQPPELTADQLMLHRHLVDKYLGELRAGAGEGPVEEAIAGNIRLAEEAIATIDGMLAAITAAAAVAAAPSVPRAISVGPRVPQAVAASSPRRVARPAPSPVAVRMDAGRPIVQADPATAQGGQGPQATAAQVTPAAAAAAAPRRVPRPAPPPVTVRMDADRPIVQEAPVAAPEVASIATDSTSDGSQDGPQD